LPIIAVTGRKGGIGKSTITANLAAELAGLFGYSVAVLDTDPQRSLKAWAGLGEGLLAKVVEPVEATRPDAFRRTVEKAVQRADLVLIDTPPGFADPALLAAAGPSPLDIMAAKDALELAREARMKRSSQHPVIRFVPSKVVARTGLSRDLAASLEGLGEPVLPPIGQRTVVAEAALSGLTVREYAKGSPAQQEFEALARAVEEVLHHER
jgi:chromosome partitioning protein